MATGTDNQGAPPESQPSETGESLSPPRNRGQAPGVRWPLLEELKRRNVVRVALLYLVVCWLILEPVHVIFHMLEVPLWANRLVITLMALGFPAIVIFAWAFEITSQGLKLSHEVERHASITRLTGQRLDRAIVAVLAVALTYFVIDKFWVSRRLTSAEHAAAQSAQPSPTANTTIPEKSIAVLPFVNMSSEREQDYFSDGLSEELIDLLTQVPDLRVPARTSSFYFKGKSEDIVTIAQKLRVAHLLEGSVRKSGHTLRVTAQLIRVDSGYHLWSQTYDRDIRDIFSVQDEIASAVVSALKVKLLVGNQVAHPHRTENSEAYNQYLLGLQFSNRTTTEDYRRAVVAYQAAIALDPNYAAAFAGLAYAEGRAADDTGDTAGLQRALALADKAVALAPTLAEGYATRGFLRFSFFWDWAGAQVDFAKATELDSGDTTIQRYYSLFLGGVGRLAEAIATTRRAIELDPLSALAWLRLSEYLFASGQVVASRQAVSRALEISPESRYANFFLGFTELREGKAHEALATFMKAGEVFSQAGVAMAEHSLGHARESQQALDELIAKYARGAAYQISWVYAWRGDKDTAFEWLERAYTQRDGGISRLKFEPVLAGLRTDPRYAALLRKMNLAE